MFFRRLSGHRPAPRPDRHAGRRALLAGLAAAPLAGLGALAGLATLTGRPRRALAKAPKQAVQYQPEPNDGEQCSGCIHYLPDERACKLVEGEIAPDAWCSLYEARGG